jgi:hypothetical protein
MQKSSAEDSSSSYAKPQSHNDTKIQAYIIYYVDYELMASPVDEAGICFYACQSISIGQLCKDGVSITFRRLSLFPSSRTDMSDSLTLYLSSK